MRNILPSKCAYSGRHTQTCVCVFVLTKLKLMNHTTISTRHAASFLLRL